MDQQKNETGEWKKKKQSQKFENYRLSFVSAIKNMSGFSICDDADANVVRIHCTNASATRIFGTLIFR